MAAERELLEKLARISLDAELGNYEIEQFYLQYPELDVHDGYQGLKRPGRSGSAASWAGPVWPSLSRWPRN